MSKRPISVTVVAWLLIIVGGHLLITNLSSQSEVRETTNYSPIYLLQLIYSYVKISFALISGIGILNRQNWARFLYLIGWIIYFVIHIVKLKPMTTGVIGGTILFIITVFFLFRPKANDYFAVRDSKNAPAET